MLGKGSCVKLFQRYGGGSKQIDMKLIERTQKSPTMIEQKANQFPKMRKKNK